MNIICTDCGEKFNISDGEINYYLSHKLSRPKRCKRCRDLRAMGINGLKSNNYYNNIQLVDMFPIEGGTCNYSTTYKICVEDKNEKQYVSFGQYRFWLTPHEKQATTIDEDKKELYLNRVKEYYESRNIKIDVYAEGTKHMGHYYTLGIFEESTAWSRFEQ